MKSSIIFSLATLSLLHSLPTFAEQHVQLGIGSDTIALAGAYHANHEFDVVGEGIYHQDNGTLLTLGAYGAGNQGSVDGRIGAKLFALDADSADAQGYGLALGGEAAIWFRDSTAFEVSAHYAPSITSFSDFDSYTQFDARLIYQIFQSTAVFIGYRLIELDLVEGGTGEFDDRGYVGIRIGLNNMGKQTY